MEINKPIYPLDKNLKNTNDKELFYLYIDNIIDIQSLSRKDRNYKINKLIVSNNINSLKKELIKRKNKYLV